VSSAQTIATNLNRADDSVTTLGACWDAFDYIGQAADHYAEPDSDLFAAFVFAARAANEGRDSVGHAPSMPPTPVITDGPIALGETEPGAAAGILATLAAQVKAKLSAPTAIPSSPADQAAFSAAARCAVEIADLLASP
jgi:hypothetical protein